MRDLLDLRRKAQEVSGKRVHFMCHLNGQIRLIVGDDRIRQNNIVTLEELERRLSELAMPPILAKPETVMIPVPFEWAVMRSKESVAGQSVMGIDVNNACRQAVMPFVA